MDIQFEERLTASGQRLGIATLHSVRNLNALSLFMIRELDARLALWADDPDIVCVFLRGSGTKAFCAGGDVLQLIHACRDNPGEVPPLAEDFFATEYRLDYRIHTYPKPLIVWGHGFVMGGGMGLMQGGDIRIVTPSSRLAMPEISIGLYPDVGGSWFLNRMPGKLGLFMGLTGAHMNARDALDLGLADRFLRDDQQDALLDGLEHLDWRHTPQRHLWALLHRLEHEARPDLPAAQWLPRRERIDALLDVPNLPEAWDALCAVQDDPDPLMARSGKTLAQGCPLTAWLVWMQLQCARHLSLPEVFRLEYILSLNCCRHPEFPEGVRARLLDKDHTPHWTWPEVRQVPEDVVSAHFRRAWVGPHPLADLGHTGHHG